MDNACDIVRDLLPLYVDGVCSASSRRMIDGHIKTCSSCAKVLGKLQNSACEDTLLQEAKALKARHGRRWRNRTYALGCALAGFLAVPACVGAALHPGFGLGGWDWLALLAPALLLLASVTMIPQRCWRRRGRWTLLGFTASLLLLLMTCAVYAGGCVRWIYWGAAGALYVLSVGLIVPWSVKELEPGGIFRTRKNLAIPVWAGAWLLLAAVGLGVSAQPPHYILMGLGSVGLLIVLGIAEFIVARKIKLNGLIRAGICLAVAGNALGWLETPLLHLTGAERNVEIWMGSARLTVLLAATALGVVLVAAGLWRAYRAGGKTA